MTTQQRLANGLNRPRYFDRQLLDAADLALEQGYSDARIALMARHCIGWGTASGLMLAVHPGSAADGRIDLAVGAGYGVTPLGDEVYLPQGVVFEDIAAAIAGACGQGHDCADLRAGAPAAGTVTSAWIIARPTPLDGSPRPAMPEGCGNPGNNLKPSRRCGGASIEIACALVAPHGSSAGQPVEDAHALVCGPWGAPMPDPIADAANYVVLGAVEARADGVFATPLDRRTIGRLDRVGRIACACQPEISCYVTHILPDQSDVDRRIDKVAGVDAVGRLFIQTLDEAIAAIEGGARYMTLTPDHQSRSIAVRRRGDRKYLRSEAGTITTDNLMSLPHLKPT